MRCTPLAPLALSLLLAFAAGCLHYGSTSHPHVQTTGTCPGACEHYLKCKGATDDHSAYAICVAECRDIYEDNAYTLASYERLACEDAVAFVEGESGRGPGD